MLRAGVHLGLGQKADVPDGKRVVVQDVSQSPEIRAVFGRLGQIVYLVAILAEVVQFLGRFALPEVCLRRLEPALIEQLFPNARGRRLEHVSQILPLRFVRHVVANV